MNRAEAFERARKIFALVNSGATFTELAQKYGMSRQHVAEIYNTFGTRKPVLADRPKTGVQAAKSGLPVDEWRKFSRLGALRAFNEQRRNAEVRGIGWEMTIYEWWGVWEASGKWAERGRGKGQYVMARTGDVGPYKVGNVRIATSEENVREAAQVRRAKTTSRTDDEIEDLHSFVMSGKIALVERG